MTYRIVKTHSSLVDLERMVQAACGEGFEPTGGAFRSADTGEWAQTMFKRAQEPANGERRLKEPKRA